MRRNSVGRTLRVLVGASAILLVWIAAYSVIPGILNQIKVHWVILIATVTALLAAVLAVGLLFLGRGFEIFMSGCPLLILSGVVASFMMSKIARGEPGSAVHVLLVCFALAFAGAMVVALILPRPADRVHPRPSTERRRDSSFGNDAPPVRPPPRAVSQPVCSWNEVETSDHRIIIVRFAGTYPPGSAGNDFAREMVNYLRSVLSEVAAGGVVFDLTFLEYEWGDAIGSLAFPLLRGDKPRPAAIVAHGQTASALKPLLQEPCVLGVAGVALTESVEEAIALVESRCNSESGGR